MTTATLGSVAEFVNGAAFKPEDWGDSGARIIRIQNLTDPNKPFNRTTRTVTDKIKVRPGDLLVSWSATLGVFVWSGPDEAILNQHIFRVIPDEDRVEKRYLRHALEVAIDDMRRHLHGATMQHVNRGDFLNTRFHLPPKGEQRRIADILDRADALRAKRRAALAQLDTLTQSIFLDMFGDQRTILSRWPTKRLGDLLEFVTSGSRGWAEHYAETGDLFLRIQNVGRDELRLDDIARVNAPDTAEARRTLVQPGDVLLSITADLGRAAVVPEGLGRAFINQHLSILRAPSIVPQYLSAYIASPAGQQQVSGRNRHGVKAGLNFDDIRSLLVPLPSIDLQRRFANHAASVANVARRFVTSMAGFDELFSSLQHRAFRGEL